MEHAAAAGLGGSNLTDFSLFCCFVFLGAEASIQPPASKPALS